MIKVENVKKQYGSFQLECSMQIHEGMITALIGENGSGKSTLFKLILGLNKVDCGNIVVNARKQEIGVVLADGGFSEMFNLSAIEKILENTYTNFDQAYFNELVMKFGLDMKKPISSFSTGMKVKAKVIQALSHHAKLLILDEPTTGLDVKTRNEISTILRDYMDMHENASILISSHISSDLENLCDDFYMIDHGSIIYHEDTDVLLSEYALLKVDDEQFNKLDKEYILKMKKERFGYSLLTNQKRYYKENYPDIVVENMNIDRFILMMIEGE